MSKTSRQEYLEKIRWRYHHSDKRAKSKILDEFCEVCGHSRKHAIKLINGGNKERLKRPGPESKYQEVVSGLKAIWLASDQMCSKRLKTALRLWLPFYEKGHGKLKPLTRKKLRSMSAATMDRMLKPIRFKYRRRGLSGTKPGSLLKNQISIRTDNWDIKTAGFMEADTVAHCGNSLSGDFVWSLVFTDIASGWTDTRGVWNKGAHGVIAAVQDIEAQLPFELLGFDCDNGSEFLNHHLWSYFVDRKKPVQFTRSRPYKKNDNAHVEQKNWTHVRQLLGYDRLENPKMVELLNELYRDWSLYQNFFCPSMKLIRKKRIGSKYYKKYDKPKTPHQRLMRSKHISKETKQKLTQTFKTLDPFELKKSIDRKLKAVFDLKKVKPV